MRVQGFKILLRVAFILMLPTLVGCDSLRIYDNLVNLGYSSDYAVGYTRVSNPAFGPLANVREDNPEYKRGQADAKAGVDYQTAQRQAPPR